MVGEPHRGRDPDASADRVREGYDAVAADIDLRFTDPDIATGNTRDARPRV